MTLSKKHTSYAIVLISLVVFVLFGIKTPLTGEAQLIGKAFLMLCICYFVLFILLSMVSLTSKKVSWKEFGKKWFFLFYFILAILFVLNVPFDLLMQAMNGRYLPNEACTIIAFISLLITVFGKSYLAKKL